MFLIRNVGPEILCHPIGDVPMTDPPDPDRIADALHRADRETLAAAVALEILEYVHCVDATRNDSTKDCIPRPPYPGG